MSYRAIQDLFISNQLGSIGLEGCRESTSAPWIAHKSIISHSYQGNDQRVTRKIHAVPITRKIARKKSVVSRPRR